MPNGFGFGFRGSSPPWPYIGRGRGGLPRCWHPGLWNAPAYLQTPYPGYGAPWGMPSAPQMTREQELDLLKSEAEAIKSQLEQIDARMHELESEEK
ncbi:MAG: DUF5320 domain-containing protein [Chloroflexi bacterium]|nr:DUF5320 domain-containing protein [Chloroflexota bacterium]MBL7061567.1 DUF5320 domain-containing protein [Dehalococcoidia bacterium]